MNNYIDGELIPVKVNVIGPEKEHCKPHPTKDKILLKSDISKVDCYHDLSISVDDDYELHHIRSPNSCFVNNYFDTGLRAWQANMDIQTVFDEYNAVAYMCSYFLKSEDNCSFSMKQVALEAFVAKLDQVNNMKNILKAYISNKKCSIQDSIYHILPEPHLRRVFPGLQFVKPNLSEESSKVLLTEE